MKDKLRYDILRQLVEDTSAIVITDDQTLIEKIPLASRLWALGVPEPLEEMLKELGPSQDSLSLLAKCIRERTCEGIWDLTHSDGLHLGLSVLEAQDWFFFRTFLRTLPPALVALNYELTGLEAWAYVAAKTPLDSEAVQIVENYSHIFGAIHENRYPDHRLMCVKDPIEGWIQKLLHRGRLAKEALPLELQCRFSTINKRIEFFFSGITVDGAVDAEFTAEHGSMENPNILACILPRNHSGSCRRKLVYDIDSESIENLAKGWGAPFCSLVKSYYR
jgi:hypothetical protein